MAYRLEPGEPLGAAVRRIVAEELHDAVDQLEGRGAPERDTAVHEARKDLKKARSALRFVRDDLGEEVRARENEVLGDAGRRLSGVRDAEVLLKTLGKVADDEALERRRDELVAHAHDEGGAAEDAARALREAERRVATWPLGDEAPKALRRGLLRLYARGQATMGRAVRDGADDEHWHDWRKRVKDLWYALRILEPLAPRILGGMVAEAAELSDVLGDHNDLAVLDVAVDTHAAELRPGDAEALHTAVRARRDALRAQARLPGALLYAEDPRAFGRRIRAYAKAAAAETPAAG